MAVNKMTASINDGPSRQGMFDVLSVRREYDSLIEFILTFGKDSHKYAKNVGIPVSEVQAALVFASLTGVSWEDGSGESFNISGHLQFVTDSKRRWFPFIAYFQTLKRRGHMTITV